MQVQNQQFDGVEVPLQGSVDPAMVAGSIPGSSLPADLDQAHAMQCKAALLERYSVEELPDFDLPSLPHWDQAAFLDQTAWVEKLCSHLQSHGCPGDSPFVAATIETLADEQQEAVQLQLSEALKLLEQLLFTREQLAEDTGLQPAQTLNGIEQLRLILEQLARTPSFVGVAVTDERWLEEAATLAALLNAGSEMAELQYRHADQLVPEAWAADVSSIQAAWKAHGQSRLRLLKRDFRQAKAMLDGLLTGPVPAKYRDVLTLLDAISNYQVQQRVFEQHVELGQQLFASRWETELVDWNELIRIKDWLVKFRTGVSRGEYPQALLTLLETEFNHDALAVQAQQLQLHRDKLAKLLNELKLTLQLESFGTLAEHPLVQLRDTIRRANNELDSLPGMMAFNQLRREMVDKGLTDVALKAFTWRQSPALILAGFQWQWYSRFELPETAANPIPTTMEPEAETVLPEVESVPEVEPLSGAEPLSDENGEPAQPDESSQHRAINDYRLVDGNLGLATDKPIHLQAPERLLEAVTAVVKAEGPVLIDVVMRRALEASGKSRMGPRIQRVLQTVIDQAVGEGIFNADGQCLYYPEQAQRVRNRLKLSDKLRKVELIPSLEIRNALRRPIEAAFSLERDESVNQALTLLGLPLNGKRARAVLQQELDAMLAEGRLGQRGDRIVLAAA